MRQKARTRPTGPDVRAQGLDTATLGRSICQHISVKGFCIIDPEVEEEYLDSVLADISAVDEQGRFVSLPAGIVEGLLGKEGSCRVADVGVTTEHAMVSVFTESFVRDGAALRYFDDEFSRYANLLFAHLALAKIPVTSRSSSLLHEAAKPKSEGPALTEEVCSKWLRVMSSHRLICIWCLGPENGTLELKPWDEDAESMQVSMRPGRLVIARADALHHRFSSVGCAYCLTCFFNNIVAAEQEPVSPCGFALQQWAKERMTRYKQSTVQEQRYMEMPRDWEEKINREMVNTQRIALRTACTKQPGTEDTLGFALAMNSGPDYALSVPMMRWEHEMVYEDDIMAWQNGKTCCMHGAFIEGIELFDCTAFRISRAEASGMDPGHRLTLETGYEALVKDGYRANTLMNSRGGVYVANPPPVEWAMTPKDISAGGVCGGGGSIACGRFSFVHGLKGPCISVDVEGASSLVVVNYACANLSWTGGWEPIPFALCNSWNLQLNPAPYVHLSSCGLLSPKGRTFAFDASACGYIRGDCVTSIVLKAGNVEGEAENELGYLAGSATNQSGRRSHLAAPDCLALQEVIHEALRQTQITGLDVDAVESCADGKILDDSLEATAFARAYRPQGTLNVDDTAPLGIISAKSGVGNQLEAAGISQILKVILGSRAAAFHPTPHLRIVNPHIDIEMCERNAIIAGESLDFRLPSTYTGILNRSMAGTNCHAIVFAKVPSEVYRPRKAIQAPYKEAVQPILFWPKGGGALAEDMQPRMGYSIMGTFTRWRPQPMQMEGPGVYGATIILSENRWERFQIAVDGDTGRVLHPILPQGDKCCPVAGPEAVLQILSWHIEGRPKDAMQAEDLPDTSQQKQLTIGDSSAWTVIVPDELPSFDDQTAVAGDRFRVRLHVQGRWRMVDWEKLPKDEETDTPADRAFRASLDGLVGTYQVVGSWTMNDCQVQLFLFASANCWIVRVSGHAALFCWHLWPVPVLTATVAQPPRGSDYVDAAGEKCSASAWLAEQRECLNLAPDAGGWHSTKLWMPKFHIAWWDLAGEIPYTGKLLGGNGGSPTAVRLRALLEAGGASFYDDDRRNFLKSPMVSLVAIGGVPVRPTSTDTLEMLYGDTVVPVPLEGIRKSLRNQMGMTAMFSYLNRRAVPAEEMWEVVAGLGHFSVGHAAHLSFVLVGHSCAVENEINSQRDVVHLGRLTVARTRAQKDPPLVVQLPELLPAYKELRQKVEECILAEVDKRPKSKSISIQDWQEALYLGWPSAKAHVAVLTGSLRNLQKLVSSIDDEGKEAEYRALLWQIAVACHILLPDMFPDPSTKFKWRPPDHMGAVIFSRRPSSTCTELRHRGAGGAREARRLKGASGQVTIPVSGDQQFHLLRNEDRIEPGAKAFALLKELGVDDGFERFCIPRFERQAEAGEDMMKVSWECVSTDAPVPEELALLHLRRKYMVRLCFGSWSNHSYKMAWQGSYFRLFLELNELAKVSFVIYEDGQTSRCLFPSVKDANPHETHELQGPGPATEGLFWTIGAHEKDQAVNGSRYELRLHLAEGGVPMSVDWVRVKSTKGLEDAAANGNFVAWLPAAS
ncbi:ppsD [Symbiodinium sp. CCMP2592]|nr:ppsD [Symbiodinium sp. CCMP2592]